MLELDLLKSTTNIITNIAIINNVVPMGPCIMLMEIRAIWNNNHLQNAIVKTSNKARRTHPTMPNNNNKFQ